MQDELKDKVKIEYIKGLKHKEICKKYDVKINTLKSWIKRYKWSEEKKRGAPQKKKGAPLNNRNASGQHQGNVGPPGNNNAEKHGFFSKYLPEDTVCIIKEIQEKNHIDILWDNIVIQYAAIIRAQKIMFITDKGDMTKELKREKSQSVIIGPKDKKEVVETYREEEYNIQFAWDKQSNFLQAQARAMQTLNSMIKQYEELLKSDLATEEQKVRINKLKVEIEVLQKEGTVGEKQTADKHAQNAKEAWKARVEKNAGNNNTSNTNS